MMMVKNINIAFALVLCLQFNCSLQAQNSTLEVKNSITDSNIEYPVDMERNYDQLLIDWRAKIKADEQCQSLYASPVLEPDSVYINRLYALPTRMELAFNQVVKQYIEMYAGRRRQQVSYMLGQGQHYFPMFEKALDKEGMPLELKYLPVIESALNPIARSRVGATGLWQFMASTGKMYNLEINSLVDERRDPAKSTEAAVRFLKDLYNTYGDWNLVIAAYNCGAGNVNKAIRYSGGQTDYWAIYPHLPRETRGYVPAFIAATYVMNYYQEHDICPATGTFPPMMDTLLVNKNLHFRQISEVLNIPVEEIRAYNPQFTTDVIPGLYKSYALNLPIDKVTAFIDSSDTIYTYRADELLTHRKIAGANVVGGGGGGAGSRIHRVKSGETLGSIASNYGVTVAQLKRWNGLQSSLINIGKRLIVSQAAPVTPAPPKKDEQTKTEERLASAPETGTGTSTKVLTKIVKVSKPQTTTTYYTIKKGDNLSSIADKQKVSIANLREWNGLKNNNISAGKKLKIVKSQMVEVEERIEYAEPIVSSISIDNIYLLSLLAEYINKVDEKRDYPLQKILSDDNSSSHRAGDDMQIIYHKVRIGETIPQIAKRYNVSKKDIMSWNKLSSGIAKVGQRLLIYLPPKDENGAITRS